MITICAVCKKELKMAGGDTVSQPFASRVMKEEVIYSHGICNECGIRLYGAEIMATVGARMSMAAAEAEVQRRDKRNNQI